MEIKPYTIKVRDLVEGYADSDEEGVVGYGGRLNIRPKYQREFVYNDKQQKAVIESIFKSYPLNVMYWVRNADGTFELLDGQQRTLSICTYRGGGLFADTDDGPKAFFNLTQDQQQHFLDYNLQIYICENGTDTERLAWFEIINIAGAQLTPQELRNAVYAGPWTMAMKRIFSKTGCVAYKQGSKYLTGKPIRQDYFQTVVGWICGNTSDESIRTYMAQHQHDGNADREWQYFQEVIAWVQRIFPRYRKEMQGLDWGLLYNRYKDNAYSATELEERTAALMTDDDVTNRRGIYPYLLSGEERHLHIRLFSPSMKTQAYERQQGVCPVCGKHFRIDEMQADHIIPWSRGGHTTADNCQMLCRYDNWAKGAR